MDDVFALSETVVTTRKYRIGKKKRNFSAILAENQAPASFVCNKEP